MGYLSSCNAENSIATCDTYNFSVIKKSKRENNPIQKSPKIAYFSYSDLCRSTDGFSRSCLLGKGSHGSVYKACLDLHNRQHIAAVKITKLTGHPINGASTPAENEIEILSRIRHPRLVNLIGFSFDPLKNRLLVVEYMPNGSLYDLLHGSARPPGWTRRVRFSLQIARAVLFLHSSNPPVIHRDIKSSNVLIDENYNARLSDLGLGLRGNVEDVHVKCIPPAGTIGYLDPGYLAPADLSTKSDVFSFGILLLEIISGRKAIDVNYSPSYVVDWAVPIIRSGDFTDIFDPRINQQRLDEESIRLLAVLASRCVKTAPAKRPTMAEVVESLKFMYKRVNSPIWNNIGRRIDCVRDSTRVAQYKPLDENQEMARTIRASTRSNGKVSSVGSLDPIGGKRSNRIWRSKSIGSFREVEIDYRSLDLRDDINELGLGRRMGRLSMKMLTVRLTKSMSLGRLQGLRLLGNENRVPVKPTTAPKDTETQESKLLLKLVYAKFNQK